MAKTRRNCRREARGDDVSANQNYHSTRAYLRARRKEKIAKASRKKNYHILKAK